MSGPASAPASAHHSCPRGRPQAPYQDQAAQRGSAPYLGEARLPPASLTDLMASQRTTARARSAIAPTHIGRKESGRQNEPGTAPADAELSCHDPDVPGRASLPLAARRLVGRMMEVFAGFLTQADHQAGRPIEFLPQLGELDTGGPRSSPATA